MKLILFSLFACVLVLGGVKPVVAGDDTLLKNVATQSGYSPTTNASTLSETIGRVIKILLTFVGTIFFVLAIYAGYIWMTAQGNSEQVEKAVGIFRTAIIGMIIIVAAYSLTYWTMIYVSQSTSPSYNIGG